MEHNPLRDLIRLLGSIFVFAVSIQLLLLLVYYFLFKHAGINPIDFISLYKHSPFAGKIFLGISSIATFILPAWYMQVNNAGATSYFQTQKTNFWQYIIVLFILVSFMPSMSLIAHLNREMELPALFSGIEAWMLKEEMRMEEITKIVVLDSTISGLLMNLVIMAVIPAVGEELIFRGCLQRIFGKWIASPHVCIWLVAIIFSAIHMQFYGFLPRMLIGALFGYLYFWSKNIYVPIFAHFLNNASVTVMAFIYSGDGKSYEEMTAFEYDTSDIYVASLILTSIFVLIYYKVSKRITNGKELD